MQRLLIGAVICCFFFTGCATTMAPTESSTNTFDKTTNALMDTTSSTSPGSSSANYQATEFTRVHYASIQRQMAAGGGEHLAALGELLAVPEGQMASFYQLGKLQYETLYGDCQQDASGVVTALRFELARHPVLGN